MLDYKIHATLAKKVEVISITDTGKQSSFNCNSWYVVHKEIREDIHAVHEEIL